jgi:hypothetical protein
VFLKYGFLEGFNSMVLAKYTQKAVRKVDLIIMH